MKACLMIIWLAIWMAMAAGCTMPKPAQEMAPGDPAGAVEKTQPATPTQERSIEPPAVPASAQALVDLARADLALKLERKAEDITLLSVEPVEFPDASLGVPEPDKMYAQVITPGYVIRFGVGDKVYTYHGSGDRVVLAPEDKTSSEPSLVKNVSSDGLYPPAAERARVR